MTKHSLTFIHALIGVFLPLGVLYLYSFLGSIGVLGPEGAYALALFALATPSIIATRLSWTAGYTAGLRDARAVTPVGLTREIETRIKR